MTRLRNRHQESQITVKRLLIIVVFFVFLYGVLIVRLYQLQIQQHQALNKISNKNKDREIHIAAYRGDIVDRNQRALATYGTKYQLNLDNPSKDLLQILQALQIPNLPSQTITQAQYAYLYNHPNPGMSLEVGSYRYYPLGAACAHLIGYTGSLSKTDYYFEKPPLEGKFGAERIYDNVLFGEVGILRQHKNAKGERFDNKILKEPKRSEDLVLTIDADLQHLMHDVMLGQSGASLVLNPQNGEILAAVSSPSYDPNLLSKPGYQKRLNENNKPMFNRLAQALYPPGSIIKPFLAIEALNEGLIDPDMSIQDKGYFQINENSKVFHDHKRTGHGKVNLKKAIAVSCDTYFYHLAMQLGVDKIVQYLEKYKFGEKTNIAMSEAKSILPTKAYRETHYKKWYQGQTVITAIGQGDVLTTPLQMARAIMLLANNGYDYPLHYVKSEYEDVTQIPINQNARALVIEAMEEVILNGTARLIGQTPYSIAGKTGTMQVVQLEDKSQYHRLPKHHKDHHAFIGFAPSENPTVAMVIVTEHQNEALNIAKKAFDWCYQHGYIENVTESQ